MSWLAEVFINAAGQPCKLDEGAHGQVQPRQASGSPLGRGLVTISVRLAKLVVDANDRSCKLGKGSHVQVQPRQASDIYLARGYHNPWHGLLKCLWALLAGHASWTCTQSVPPQAN